MRPAVGTGLLAAVAAIAACRAPAGTGADSIAESARRWARVFVDRNYDVAIDTAHLTSRRFYQTVVVWYRTDHRNLRLRYGQRWNREITKSLVWCDKLWYKIARFDLSEGNREPISRQPRPSRSSLTSRGGGSQ